MPYHHYHVIGGLAGGYLPDYNYVHHGVADARRTGFACVSDERESGSSWVGSGRGGGWRSTDGVRYVEISICQDTACIEKRGSKIALRECYCDRCEAARRKA